MLTAPTTSHPVPPLLKFPLVTNSAARAGADWRMKLPAATVAAANPSGRKNLTIVVMGGKLWVVKEKLLQSELLNYTHITR
jgi:hypothetical protein